MISLDLRWQAPTVKAAAAVQGLAHRATGRGRDPGMASEVSLDKRQIKRRRIWKETIDPSILAASTTNRATALTVAMWCNMTASKPFPCPTVRLDGHRPLVQEIEACKRNM